MSDLKKIYKIRITEPGPKGIWYNNKIGNEYNAELMPLAIIDKSNSRAVVFKITESPFFHVHLQSCIIISETLISAK